jgi:hypothetical protein
MKRKPRDYRIESIEIVFRGKDGIIHRERHKIYDHHFNKVMTRPISRNPIKKSLVQSPFAFHTMSFITRESP